MEISFAKGKWNAADFVTAASPRVEYRLTFGQAEGCIHNLGADKAGDEYAYVSMVYKDAAALPCTVSTECDFKTYGAPLIVLSDTVDTNARGQWEYGRHIEIVGWENGVNVWELIPDAAADHGQRVASLGKYAFPIGDGERFTLSARVEKNGLIIDVAAGGRSQTFECACALPERVYAGITACEGENRFYTFSVKD